MIKDDFFSSDLDKDGQGKAKHNLSMLYLEHLSNMVRLTDFNFLIHNAERCYSNITAVYKAVLPYMTPSEVKRMSGLYNKLNQAQEEWVKPVSRRLIPTSREIIRQNMKTGAFLKELHSFDTELRQVMKKNGLLVPVRKGAADVFGEDDE